MVVTASLGVVLAGTTSHPTFAQSYPGSSPVPGNSPAPGTRAVTTRTSAPIPGQVELRNTEETVTVPVPNLARKPSQAPDSLYNQLPITLDGATGKIEELNKILDSSSVSQLGKIKNNIYAMSEWLQDVANAHWKMYKAFEKSPATKAKAKTERETALAFSHLKNKAKLLKADLFIKQKRYPEALQPLVEIVVAEPNTETGKAAYKRLTDMGFSPKGDNLEIATKDSEKEAPEKK